MKCAIAIVAAALAGCGTKDAAARKDGPEVRARKASGPIVVDGRLDEAAWKDAAEVKLRSADGKAEAGRPTRVLVCWTDSTLHLAFTGEDPDIGTAHRGRDSHMWTEDVYECFIDVNPADPGYVELEVNPCGDLFDGIFFARRKDVLMSWNPDIRVAVAADGTVNRPDDVDRSWTAEMAIPVGDLAPSPGVGKPGAEIRPGTAWGINFNRVELSGKGPAELQSWAPMRGDFHETALYGRIVFD